MKRKQDNRALSPRIRDLRGNSYGRLVVIDFDALRPEGGISRAWWRCHCVCGKFLSVSGRKLTGGRTTSCGCGKRDPEVRREARMKVPAEKRREIAALGGGKRNP